MATVCALGDKTPDIGEGVYLAPTAVLVGDVVAEPGASVWFGVVIRGDFDRVVVGPGSCVQDNAVVHTATGLPTMIGRDVTVGHGALLEGCVIEDRAVIGMGSVVLQRARVGAGAMLAAGTVVTEGQEIPAGVLAAGAPARVKKEISGDSQAWVETAARTYQALALEYRTGIEYRDEGRMR